MAGRDHGLVPRVERDRLEPEPADHRPRHGRGGRRRVLGPDRGRPQPRPGDYQGGRRRGALQQAAPGQPPGQHLGECVALPRRGVDLILVALVLDLHGLSSSRGAADRRASRSSSSPSAARAGKTQPTDRPTSSTTHRAVVSGRSPRSASMSSRRAPCGPRWPKAHSCPGYPGVAYAIPGDPRRQPPRSAVRAHGAGDRPGGRAATGGTGAEPDRAGGGRVRPLVGLPLGGRVAPAITAPPSRARAGARVRSSRPAPGRLTRAVVVRVVRAGRSRSGRRSRGRPRR